MLVKLIFFFCCLKMGGYVKQFVLRNRHDMT